MKKSKLFSRVFWFVVLLWIFFLGTSAYVGFYQSPNFVSYNIGFLIAAILSISFMIGFKRKEFNTELKLAVNKYQRELNRPMR